MNTAPYLGAFFWSFLEKITRYIMNLFEFRLKKSLYLYSKKGNKIRGDGVFRLFSLSHLVLSNRKEFYYKRRERA